jgi:hypothetical protein
MSAMTDEDIVALADSMSRLCNGRKNDDVLAALSYLLAFTIIDAYPDRERRMAMLKLHTDHVRTQVRQHIDTPAWAKGQP